MRGNNNKTRWVLITGAAGSIGMTLVRAFALEGYKVVAVDKVSKPSDLDCCHYIVADLARSVTDDRYAASIFYEIEKILNRQGLQVLVNNAAIQILGRTNNLSRQDWQLTLDTNLIAPFIWVQAMLPHLISTCGSVINISSVHASLTKKNFIAYSTSKAAIKGMTRAMAIDLGGQVRVNSISPAAIKSRMLASGFEGGKAPLQKLAKCHPAKTIGEAHEVAKIAILLASTDCPFLTGSDISIDGGISSRLFDPE